MPQLPKSIEEKFEIKELSKSHFFIKRDDLIHPIISGNKWRKLIHILEDAKVKKSTHLVSFGGAYSNHLVALACAGKKHHFNTIGIVRGDEIISNHYLTLCKNYGMEIVKVSRELYKNKPLLFETYYGDNSSYYFIDEGGKSNLAIKGCTAIINELTQEYDRIYVSVGTGTTMCGLIEGVIKNNLKTKVVGVCAHKNKNDIIEYIAKYPNYTYALVTDFHFGGFGKITNEISELCKSVAKQTQILIDPVYIAKTLLAIKSDQTITKNSKCLLLHTGGWLGLFS